MHAMSSGAHVAMAKHWRAARQASELMMLTLYERPADYPTAYVVRAGYVGSGCIRMGTPAMLFGTEAEARAWVGYYFPDLWFTVRDPKDDPRILGAWI